MMLQADINVGTRSVAMYLLGGVLRVIQRVDEGALSAADQAPSERPRCEGPDTEGAGR